MAKKTAKAGLRARWNGLSAPARLGAGAVALGALGLAGYGVWRLLGAPALPGLPASGRDQPGAPPRVENGVCYVTLKRAARVRPQVTGPSAEPFSAPAGTVLAISGRSGRVTAQGEVEVFARVRNPAGVEVPVATELPAGELQGCPA
jgi:hypothetical protein